jgi:hypothetical protein
MPGVVSRMLTMKWDGLKSAKKVGGWFYDCWNAEGWFWGFEKKQDTVPPHLKQYWVLEEVW